VITVYEKSTCTTCRKLYKLLDAEGVDFEKVQYQVTGLTEGEIRDLLDKAGITPADALRMREDGARELAAEEDDAIIAAMVERPALLQRPIVVNGEKAVLARPVESVLEIL
jgi:arsenate reductase